MKLMRIGGDLAKSVFQIHGVDCLERTVWRQRLSRERWLQAIQEYIFKQALNHRQMINCLDRLSALRTMMAR